MFYKDFNVTNLKMKGDWETWANDIEEYFIVSGFSTYFEALKYYRLPTIPDDAPAETKADHVILLSQARYVLFRSIGSTIKREISKERFAVGNVLQLWSAIRSCSFYVIKAPYN